MSDPGTDPDRRRHRAAAGPGRRRPAQRRQVHAGQPDPRPPRGGRRGRPRASPATACPTTPPGPAGPSPSSTPAAGTPTPAGWPSGSRPRPRSRSGLADAVLFVVDATVGITDADESVVRVLRASKKPVILAANKVDDQRDRGRGVRAVEPRPGRARTRSRRCTAAARATFSTPSSPCCPSRPEQSFERGGRPAPGRDRRQAQRRQVVAAQQARRLRAGRRRLRRRHHRRPGRRADRPWAAASGGSSTPPASASASRRPPATSTTPRCGPRRRSTGPRSRCWCSTPTRAISEQDVRILQTVSDAGRALVIAFNKWDLVDEERRHYLEREVELELVQVQWAPRINVTARTGWHVDRLVPALDKALEGWETRVSDRGAQRLPRPPGRRAPPPGAQRQAAEDHVRDPAVDRAADVRAVHVGQARRGLRALHRATPPRGLRLRRYADRAHPAGPREAQALKPRSSSTDGGITGDRSIPRETMRPWSRCIRCSASAWSRSC